MTNLKSYKKCLSNFATGITVITTTHATGPVGVTINSFGSLSLEPPLILFNLSKTSSVMEFFIDCQFFAINFLSEGGETLSQQFASSEHLDKINWPEIIEFQGAPSCCPILKNSLAYLECENFKQYDGGDHLIFIGKVIHYDLLQGESNPLLYFRSNYRKIEAEQ